MACALLKRFPKGKDMNDKREDHELAKDEALLLRHLTSGRVLYALSGTVWVTREGDSRDHVLGPGGTFRVEGPGRIVVQALKPSRLIILSARDIHDLEGLKTDLEEEVA